LWIYACGVVDLDTRLLRAYVVVAEELSFTRAAERLHLAQQALSAQVRQLESRLGVQLFERTTRRVALTAAGEALMPDARSAPCSPGGTGGWWSCSCPPACGDERRK
jgi:hypothetical protein